MKMSASGILQIVVIAAWWWAGQATAATTYVNTATPFAWVDPSTHTKIGPVTGGVYSPTYKFNNVGGGCGTAPPTIDDTLSDQIPLGFNFAFGPTTFDSARIMTNGRLQLTRIAAPAQDNTTCGFGSPVTQLPFANAGLNNTLRIYGNDLDPTSSAEVGGYATACNNRNICFVSFASLGATPNRTFVVTWSNVPEWTNTATTGGNYNLQLIVKENGDFIYQFGTDVAGPAAATAQVGWQISTTDFDVPQVGFPANNTAIRFFIPKPVVEYKMEQSSWSGAAGQVIDTSGNNRHGTVVGAAQTTPTGKVCYGANIPVNNSAAQFDAIDTGISVPTTVGGSGTITFWYKANTAWSGGSTQDAQLLDATVVNNQWFFVTRRNTGQILFTVTDSLGNVRAAQTPVIGVAAATWKHIAVSWSFNALAAANSDHLLVYVDGVLQVTSAFTTAATLSGTIGTLYIGDNRSANTGANGSGRSLDGVIDEFRMYNYEGGSGLINRDMTATASCATISNFLITIGAATGSTCAPKNITITARDVSNATLTGYTATVNLTTSTSHGGWSTVTAAGTLTPGAVDSGASSYAFAASDSGVITLGLTNTHAETMTITVTDAGAGVSSVSASITFLDNTLVISPTDSLGTTAVAGRNHAMKAEFFKKDPSTGVCTVDTNYTGNKNLDAWYVANTSHPAGAAAPVISGGTPPGTCNIAPILTLSTTVPASSPASNNLLNVPFASGVWNFCLSTTDVGKFDLNLRDDTRLYSNTSDIVSTANTLTVRPFALGFTGIAQGALANPGGTSAGGAKFVAAEDTFQATVAGYLWQSADDANNDGVPDSGADVTNNGLTPSYAWATTLAATTPVTPATGSTGGLGGGVAIAQGSFASGSATVANLTYNQVGSMTIGATAANFLNSGITLAGSSGVVGRFYPDHFALTAVTLIAACGGTFTYMDQTALNIAYTVQAQGKSNTVTSNYSAALAYPVAAVSLVAENANSGIDLGSRIGSIPATSWVSGQYLVNAPASKFSRAAAPDGAYDTLAIGVKAVDADGAVFSARDMNATTTGACGATCDARQLGGTVTTTRVRYGRLWLQNANGSELLALPVPMETQYYSSSGFTTNTLDNCTTITTANIGLGNYKLNLTAGATTAAVPAGAFAAGRKTLTLSRPGAGNNGAADVVANIGSTTTISNATTCLAWGAPVPTPAAANLPWLLGQSCAATPSTTPSPTARATFGTFRNTNKFIFQRENF